MPLEWFHELKKCKLVVLLNLLVTLCSGPTVLFDLVTTRVFGCVNHKQIPAQSSSLLTFSGSQSETTPQATSFTTHTVSQQRPFVPNNEAIRVIRRSALTLVSTELQPSSHLAWTYLALDVNVPKRKNKSIMQMKVWRVDAV